MSRLRCRDKKCRHKHPEGPCPVCGCTNWSPYEEPTPKDRIKTTIQSKKEKELKKQQKKTKTKAKEKKPGGVKVRPLELRKHLLTGEIFLVDADLYEDRAPPKTKDIMSLHLSPTNDKEAYSLLAPGESHVNVTEFAYDRYGPQFIPWVQKSEQYTPVDIPKRFAELIVEAKHKPGRANAKTKQVIKEPERVCGHCGKGPLMWTEKVLYYSPDVGTTPDEHLYVNGKENVGIEQCKNCHWFNVGKLAALRTSPKRIDPKATISTPASDSSITAVSPITAERFSQDKAQIPDGTRQVTMESIMSAPHSPQPFSGQWFRMHTLMSKEGVSTPPILEVQIPKGANEIYSGHNGVVASVKTVNDGVIFRLLRLPYEYFERQFSVQTELPIEEGKGSAHKKKERFDKLSTHDVFAPLSTYELTCKHKIHVNDIYDKIEIRCPICNEVRGIKTVLDVYDADPKAPIVDVRSPERKKQLAESVKILAAEYGLPLIPLTSSGDPQPPSNPKDLYHKVSELQNKVKDKENELVRLRGQSEELNMRLKAAQSRYEEMEKKVNETIAKSLNKKPPGPSPEELDQMVRDKAQELFESRKEEIDRKLSEKARETDDLYAQLDEKDNIIKSLKAGPNKVVLKDQHLIRAKHEILSGARWLELSTGGDGIATISQVGKGGNSSTTTTTTTTTETETQQASKGPDPQ